MANAKTLEEVKKEIAELSKKPGSYVSERTTPISKLKKPVSRDDYYEMSARFGF